MKWIDLLKAILVSPIVIPAIFFSFIVIGFLEGLEIWLGWLRGKG